MPRLVWLVLTLVWLAATVVAGRFSVLPSSTQTPTTPTAPTAPASAPAQATTPPPGYAGSDTCAVCHEGQATSITHTRHGQVKDPRSPAATLGCESCHGP